MPYADPARQRAWTRDYQRRRRAADPQVRDREKAQLRERYASDSEHRARLLQRMADRRRRVRLRREALARIRAGRAPRRAALEYPEGGRIHDPEAWCAAGLYADADVTAVLHAQDPGYARGGLWERVTS